jgi:hypothetical protein
MARLDLLGGMQGLGTTDSFFFFFCDLPICENAQFRISEELDDWLQIALKLIPEKKIFTSMLLGMGQDCSTLNDEIEKLASLLRPLLDDIHSMMVRAASQVLNLIQFVSLHVTNIWDCGAAFRRPSSDWIGSSRRDPWQAQGSKSICCRSVNIVLICICQCCKSSTSVLQLLLS